MALARASRRVRASGSLPRKGRREHGRRWLRVSLIALGAIVLLLAVDAAWVGTTAAREADRISERLRDGADLLEAGKVGEAATSFVLADRSADALRTALGHPAAVLAGIVPGLSDDVDAARALADASGEVARTGASLTRAAAAAGWDGTTVPGLASPGSIDTEAISRALPDVEAAAAATERARALLEPIRTDGLIGPLRTAVEDARAELEDRAPTLDKAALLARLLPPFLGQGEPQRYLLIAQNLSDPRGSGGYLGSYGVLEADGGTLHLGEMVATPETRKVAPVDAPPDVRARYERFGALSYVKAATYPPDFTTSARLLIAQWEAQGKGSVDGVISVDAVWMSFMLGALGPVDTPVWPEPLTADNVVDVLGRATFELTDWDASNALQAALAASLWQALLQRTPEAQPFGEAMSRAAAERHLQIYSTHPEEQTILEDLGVAGRVPPSDDPLQVTWFGATGNRAGYFAEKEIDYHAVLSPDGWADVNVAITLHNTAPDGPPSILLGMGSPGEPVGRYQAFVNVYLPAGARVLDVRGGVLDLEEKEGGKPVVMGLIGADSGGSATLHVHYRVDGLVVPDGDARLFALDVLPQPALRPDAVHVVVELPAGVDVLGSSEGTTVDGGALRWEGVPATFRHLWVRFA